MPLWRRLPLKRAAMLAALRKLPTEMRSAAKQSGMPDAPAWHAPWLQREKLKANDFAACPLHPIIPSPRVDGYRNKCEFSFGHDCEGRCALCTKP